MANIEKIKNKQETLAIDLYWEKMGGCHEKDRGFRSVTLFALFVICSCTSGARSHSGWKLLVWRR